MSVASFMMRIKEHIFELTAQLSRSKVTALEKVEIHVSDTHNHLILLIANL